MAKKLYEESNISAIAAAIRLKNGSQDTYTVAEMADAIEDIETGGVLVTKSISENGTYNALLDDDADGYSQVTVNVSSGGGSSNVFRGSALPSNEYDGNDGDIYLLVTNGMTQGLKGDGTQCIDTGYYVKANTRVKFSMLLDSNAPNGELDYFGSVQSGGLRFQFRRNGNSCSVGVGNGYYSNYNANLKGRILFGNIEGGSFRIQDINNNVMLENNNSNDPVAMPNSSLGIFGARRNNVFEYYNQPATFYYLELFEGNTLVHRYVPGTQNGTACLYDEVDHTYLTSAVGNAFTMESSSIIDGTLINVFRKNNGVWAPVQL